MLWELLLAHVLADFVFQTKSVAENKLDFKETLKHCSSLLVISVFILILAGYRDWYLFIPVLLISVIHGIIDYLKAIIDAKIDDKWNWVLFIADQFVHIITIIGIIVLFHPILKDAYLYKIEFYLNNIDVIKSALFFILITFGGSYFTASVCKGFGKSNKSGNSLNKAGRYIGILERLIISAAILIGRYEIIGFLIAAKSIIRHHESDDKDFAEYFLVGTFTSFVWAAIFTYLYLKL